MSETLLLGYVRRALAALENGEAVDPRALCAAHPELAAAVAEAIALHAELPAMHREAARIDPLVGRVLGGRYRLESKLGQGAMGVVYAAHDLELERAVAVKRFALGGGGTPEAAERFQREALALARLDHDHVVRVFDRGADDDGEPWLVMERLSGSPLSEVLRGPRPQEPDWVRTAASWLADVAAGLARAHELGVWHRDVKPSNVFIRDDGGAVLIDFGIAVRSGDAALTATTTSIGTPWYMAPEQLLPGHHAGPELDVYALCATLYHLLARQPPYDGDAAQVLARLAHEDPAPLARLRRELPRDLVAIVERGMERAPKQRYPSMAALEADLRAFLEYRTVAARPLSTVARWTRSVRRRPARSAAVLASALAAAVIAIAVPLALERRARERTERYRAEVVSLPRLLTIETSPQHRASLPAGERRAWIAALDRILALDGGDLLRRLQRDALALDDGDFDGAAGAWRALAREHPSPYLQALAERHARADRTQHGVLALDLADLPEPATAVDRMAASFVAMRARSRGAWQRAADWLAGCDARGARELRLMALAGLGKDRAEELHREASEVEANVLGFATALTVASRGVARTFTEDWEEAAALLERADAMCPGQPEVLVNLGICDRRLGDGARAEQRFRAAIAARPSFWQAHHNLALVHKDRLELTAAREVALRMPVDQPGAATSQADLLGRIMLSAAMENDDAAERGRLAGESAQHYARAAELARGAERDASLQRAAVSRAVATGDWAAAVDDLVLLMEAEPDDPDRLKDLYLALERSAATTLDAKLAKFLLLALARRLSPRDTALHERSDAALDALRAEIVGR